MASTPLAHINELARLAAKAGRFPPAAQVALMYRQYARFDRLVAARLTDRDQTLFGMPGACLDAFRQNRKLGGFNVFHAVNAHPLAHNAALLEQHETETVRGELIPDGAAARVSEELETADMVLSPSQSNTAGLVRFGVPSEKIATVGYGVDLARFDVSLGSDATPDGAEPIRLLFVGQISFRKGVDTLISAMRALADNFLLTMAGPIVSPSVLLDVPANVRICGSVSQEHLAHLYNEADVLVLPSVEDACALVTFEAAATGLPVITTRENGASEYLNRRALMLVRSADAGSLASALGSVTKLSLDVKLQNRADLLETRQVVDWAEYAERVMKRVTESGTVHR
ncbi:glycosyltransferase family 4 protein [uncultured Jatrophihabitans sp.]|uniref:glycosyltransferase family 4 protein n=1 Tax=uncultured Jatrophihabitans sp. TaxID=1610747 RepID=UPI0035C9CF0C